VAGQTCYPPQPDGGIYGHCIADGNQIEGKVIGAYCCNRTSPDSRGSVISTEIVVDGGCAMQAPPSVGICSVCGDKVCAAWENHCNCPADCP
jgi:hypothetical protein